VGLALFRDGVLVRAGAVRGPAAPGRGPAVWSALAQATEAWLWQRESIGGPPGPQHLVVETMRYDHASRKGSAEDLLEVQAVGAAIVGRLAADCWTAHEAPAHQWVRVPRDIFGRRVEVSLRESNEWDKVEVPSRATELNDVMHAVGIGRWWLRL
jgi:hypothetical protein